MRFAAFISISFLLSLSGLSQKSQTDFLRFYQEYVKYEENEEFEACIKVLDSALIQCQDISEYSKAWVFNNLGISYWELGDFYKSITQYQLAIKHIDESQSASMRLMNNIYNNLALVYDQIGDSDRALTYYNEARRILGEIELDRTTYLNRSSTNLLNRGIVYVNLNQYDTAIHVLLEAKKIKEQHKQEYLGSVYFNLAKSYDKLDQNHRANEYYLKSMNQWIVEKGENYYQLGNIYLMYANFLLKNKSDSLSLIYYNRALKIYIISYGEKHPFVGSAYANLSDYYLHDGDYSTALKNIQSSLIAYCPDYLNHSISDNPDTCKSSLEIGIIMSIHKKAKLLYKLAMQDTTTITKVLSKLKPDSIPEIKIKNELMGFALETNDLAISRMLELHKDFPSRESQLFLLENYKKIYLSGIQIASESYDITKDKFFLEKAFQYASDSKALELDFEKQEKERIFLSSKKDSGYLAILSLSNQISTYENLIQHLSSLGSRDSMKLALWQKERFKLEVQFEKAILDFRATVNDTIHGVSNRDNSISGLQKKIKRNEVIIEYTLSDASEEDRFLYSFVISKRNFSFSKQKFDAITMHDCNLVLSSLKRPDFNTNSTSQNDSLYRSLGRLYLYLLHPFEQEIRRKDLIIVPDEEILYIPFEALIIPYENKSQHRMDDDYGGRYLINNHAVSYLHSSKEYGREKGLKLKIPSLTAISPDYVKNNIQLQYALPGAGNEGRSVSEIFDGTYLEHVEKEELKKIIDNEDIIHFALHAESGTINRFPNLIFNTNDDATFSNRLFDYEVNTLKSNADLVVLSACETSVGEHFSGEGILNMSRSFSLAGAHAVIHSLWSIDDGSSKKIMLQFYSLLRKGRSKSRALQKAKLEYLDTQSPSFHHPYYWAGYQLYGDTSKVMISRWILLLIIIGVPGLTGVVILFRK